MNTRLEAGAVVPVGWVAVGDPARILPPGEHERIWEIQRALDFPVWGVEREAVPQAERIRRYARALSRQRADGVEEGG